jgi:transcriptional regulator with XRE-family HTH domain
MDFAKQLGRRMRRARIERGITQTELAAAAEVGANYVPRLERGEMVPSVEAAFRIARALGVSLDSLCGRTSRRGAEEAIEALSHLASSDAATLRRVADAVERASGSSRRGPVGRP